MDHKVGTVDKIDVFLRDGEIIDPAQGIHGPGSIAIQDGKILAVGQNISSEGAKIIFDLRGKILSPALIDIHCHPAQGFSALGVPPDEVGLNTGVVLLGDAGTAGAANFEALKKLVVEPAQTEVLCFLNVAKAGLISLPEIHTIHDIDVELSRQVVEANRTCIRGIKLRVIEPLAEGVGLKGMEMAKKLASDLRLPLMIHIGEPRERVPQDPMDDFSRAAVSLLEAGDILSHFMTWEPGGMVLKDGTIYPELERARQRGVFLDSCHGLWHFNFTIARQALAKGFKPDIISTDLSSVNVSVVQSLPVTMSKFLNLGLSMDEVVEATTIHPAKALGEENRLGSLKVGMPAHITVFELLKGDFLFGDGKGRESMHGNLLLEPRMVFKGGKMRPAYSRYHIPTLYQ
ncbi:MAG: amidohydrolase family protein [Deltaproteobacteria bacterium]|nr:amidohydrolase family protein [Deltaproteobacteria bacterium]